MKHRHQTRVQFSNINSQLSFLSGSQRPKQPQSHKSIPPPSASANNPTIHQSINPRKLGRNAHERLLRIHHAIASQTYPRFAELLVELGVCRKTLKRDLRWMKTCWDLPIRYNRDRRGYFYAEPVDQFPGVPSVTEAEMFALLVAHKAIEQYQNTPFHQPLQMAFQKLTSQLDRKVRFSLQDFDSVLSFRPFAPEVLDLERFEAITRAFRLSRTLRFEYRKPKGPGPEFRQVQPYKLVVVQNLWYLIGHDEERGDWRTFALCRICGPVIVGDKFQKVRNFNLDKALEKSFGILQGDGDHEVILEFDSLATDMMQGRLWHRSQKIVPLANGASKMTLRLSALEEVERWVLGWGTHATIVGPPELRTRVGQIARELCARYPINSSSLAAPKSDVDGSSNNGRDDFHVVPN